jgi:predicted nucleic acid-binding protein
MDITIDANILFACLIKDSDTRKLFFSPNFELYAPVFMLTELQKYFQLIKKKSGLSDLDFSNLVARILVQVTIVNDTELAPFVVAASSLTSDKKDWLYLACALYKNTVIWSNDKEFKNQKRVKIFTTGEMLKEAEPL